ncbi:THAP domain-containing protein 10 [Acipenser ruthenus]|uniref:THAP domain-containing protein 10 n=1 Tax=Acipenser ruthenus TaxID=7906 RepID=A0A662YSR6_ACIRT|nr:THAP domain-containing protein 10 [Acipenser ruthenus]
MPRRCVADGCSNTNNGRFKLHKWPKDPKVTRVWTAFVQKTRAFWMKPTKWSHLCSAHFEEQCYNGATILRSGETTAIARSCGIQPRLRVDAYPTVRPKKASIVAKSRPSRNKCVSLSTKHGGLSGSNFDTSWGLSAGMPYMSPLDLLVSAAVSLTHEEEDSKNLDPSFSTVFTSTPQIKEMVTRWKISISKERE